MTVPKTRLVPLFVAREGNRVACGAGPMAITVKQTIATVDGRIHTCGALVFG
jgi:hypothetical protein